MFPLRDRYVDHKVRFGEYLWGTPDGTIWLGVTVDGEAAGYVRVADVTHTFTEGWE
jgi:hypothetical protein